ncbi:MULTISPECIES: hypothetical protein [Streptomyces]|uniref:hypothetical protein n=1 Tax=Streptomyces TaxID=1883 RepID=UPI0018756385|nr:hypothetical protein [Streptomyces viridodiastaticus]MCX4625044.1 hypothetical protein [Streptomyces viridodiastaticus]GGQ88612.1 hypothetical protein GCM10010250_69430 [Streptomyces althioticus]
MIDPMQIDLPAFLRNWHGPSDAPVTPLASSYSWLPAPLREWYELSSRWSTPLITLKEMFTPDQIQPERGRAIFMQDYGDQAWAFEVNEPSVVLEGQPDGSWKRSAESLPEFLVHNAIHESAYNTPFWRACNDVPDSRLPEILATLQEVSFGGWLWPRPGHKIFLGEGLIANVGPAMEDRAPWGNVPGYWEVQIGAIDAIRLDYLDGMHDIRWMRSISA